jgi:hypothetical protein
MKILTTLLLTFYISVSFGQQLKFNNEYVDSVFIKSHISSYQFDDKGTTKGHAEKLIIAFNKKQNQYLMTEYIQDQYNRTIEPDTIELKTKINKVKTELIENINLTQLLTAVSSNERPLNIINNLDSIELQKFVNEKQIRKIAKQINIDWQFKMKYTTKEENGHFFNSFQSKDTLRIYLQERFDSTGFVMISDYSNTINIWIKTENTKYRFEGKYPNPVKQPWYNHSDSTKVFGKPILNLQINRALMKILPAEFLLKNSISTQALYNDYIRWYFERREMN